jgi:inositol phosphorylceramide mannosyltransferase catalytic subunit
VSSPIPRILHQVWLGPNPLPAEFAAYRETWREHNPDWTLELWTEDHLPDALRRGEVYDRLRVPAERADILRLEVLWRFGGVYVDTDFECLRSLEQLLDGVDFFTAYLKPGRVNNAIIGATAGHPILDRALDELSPAETYKYDKEAAGPLFLDRLVKDYPEITIFAPEIFYPATPGERERAVAIHHAARSWKDADGFRQAAARARERTSAAQVERARLVAEEETLVQRLQDVQRLIERARSGGRIAPPGLRRLRRAPGAIADRAAESARFRARRVTRRAQRWVRAFAAAAEAPGRLVLDAAASRAKSGRGPAEDVVGVPRIVHQIWLSAEPLPRELEAARRSWERRNPGWDHRVWTDDHLPPGLRRPETAQRLRSPEERSQLLRLEVLRLFGGVYVDPDVAAHAPLDRAIGAHTLAAATFDDGRADDSLLLATPGDPAIERLLDAFPVTEYSGQEPATVAALLSTEPGVELLPPGTVATRGSAREEGAVAVRLYERDRERQEPKAAALEAEKQLAAAQKPLEAAERAAAHARAQLADAERELADLQAGRRRRPVTTRSD